MAVRVSGQNSPLSHLPGAILQTPGTQKTFSLYLQSGVWLPADHMPGLHFPFAVEVVDARMDLLHRTAEQG